MAKKVYIDFQLRFKGALEEIQELQSELVQQVSELRGQYADLDKKVDEVGKSAEKSNEKSSKSTKKATGATVAFTGALASLTGGATAAFVALKTGIASAVAGFATLKVAVMSSGIGLLAIAIISVIQAFKRSEAGQNKFAKIMAMIGAVTDQVMDAFASLGEMIIEVFESPKKAVQPLLDILENVKNKLVDVFTNPLDAIKNFGNMLVGNIVMRFKAFMDSLGKAGKAVAALFSGEFKEAGRLARSSASSLADAVTGVENSVEKTTKTVKKMGTAIRTQFDIATMSFSDFVDALENERKAAGEIADERARAVKLERDLVVARAKADRDRAALLEKSVDKEKFTVEERIGFLQEAARIEEEITNREIEAARIKFEAQKRENSLGKSTTEELNKEAELKAELIRLETARLTKQKEVTSQIVAFRAEARAERDAEVNEFLAENVFVFGVGFVNKAAYEEKLAEAKTRGETLERIEKEFREKNLQETFDLESQKLENERKVKLAELELLEATEEQKAEVRKYYDNQITKTKKKEEEQRNKDQEELLQQGIANVISIVGANSKFGKGIAAANAIRDTFAGANKAFAQGGIFGFIQAAAIIAAGLANVKTILASKDPAPPAGINPPTTAGEPSISVPSASAVSIPPQFDTVGASGTNQLAQIFGAEQQPVRAFVVSGDVSTAQEMDRNIVSSASLG